MILPMLGLSGSHRASRVARVAITISLLVGICMLIVIGAWPAPSGPGAALTPDDIARQFCMPVPTAAQVSSAEAITRESSVLVPEMTPAYDAVSSSMSVRKGDVVKITVSSRAAGAVGVHGLSPIYAIRPGEPISIKFRAIYSGRFPLHFHGTDGAHFALISIDVGEDNSAPRR